VKRQHRGLTQAEAARRLGVDQPKVSNLVRGKLNGFTFDRLLKYALALGNDVEIVVREHHDNGDGQGQLRVNAA
jgi:predicted XRE-type DNA-binding protein